MGRMIWTEINFGKQHRGNSLPQVLFTDPDWFFWAWENDVFHDRQAAEAKILHARACSIKVPQTGTKTMEVEYAFYYEEHTFAGFDLVPASRPPHRGSTPIERCDHIDMSVPRRKKKRDKLGYRIFLRSLTFHLFGDESRRMTRKRSEEFFDNKANFI